MKLNSEEELGLEVIKSIVEGRLVHVHSCSDMYDEEESAYTNATRCEAGHVLVWSANAFEQVGAFVNQLVSKEFDRWANGNSEEQR